jgi:5-methylcytosine-specific restriction endonuclease McrA
MKTPATCRQCGLPLPPVSGRGRPRTYCSAVCRLAHHRTSGGAQRAAIKHRRSDQGREWARLYQRRKGQVGTKDQRDPSFDRFRIFSRDRMCCQLCGRKVQTTRPQALDAATIHLKIPTALGGRYSLENGETACRQCNGRACAMVARSLNDPSFMPPRSLRVSEGHGAASLWGPLSTSMVDFGPAPATSEVAEVSLVSVSPQRLQDDA